MILISMEAMVLVPASLRVKGARFEVSRYEVVRKVWSGRAQGPSRDLGYARLKAAWPVVVAAPARESGFQGGAGNGAA